MKQAIYAFAILMYVLMALIISMLSDRVDKLETTVRAVEHQRVIRITPQEMERIAYMIKPEKIEEVYLKYKHEHHPCD